MTDEDSDVETTTQAEEVEVAPSTWGGYSWYLLRKAGRGAMTVINYLGEKLAYGLGITTPDWQYAIDIHEDMLREEREEKEAEEKALREQQRELRELEAQMASNTDTSQTPS